MTLVSFLIFLAVFCALAFVAYWVITKFLPAPMHNIALGITGVILLVVLLIVYLPEAANYPIFGRR